MGYIEQSPGDVRRMIEEYARREVLIKVLRSDNVGFDADILLPCSLSFPYVSNTYALTRFFERMNYGLQNTIDHAPIIALIAGTLVMTANNGRVIYRFTDRQGSLLLDKLALLHRDMATGTVQKVY